MSPSDKQPAPEDRRAAIVGAADDLLERGGLEHLTIRSVLARTGLARRAFYECFAGKDDLVLAVFEDNMRRAAGHFRDVKLERDDALTRLEYLVRVILGANVEGGESDDPRGRRGVALSREHLRLAESRPAELEKATRPLIEAMVEELERGMAQGIIRRADPQILATLVYQLVSATAHTELIAQEEGRSRAGRGEFADATWEFCRRAIAA